jgi:hypothetical protein
MKILRKYNLTSEGDDSYSLIFDDDGTMYVQAIRNFDQPFKKSRGWQIAPDEFHKCSVGGRTIKELVLETLEAVLAPEPKQPDIHEMLERLSGKKPPH